MADLVTHGFTVQSANSDGSGQRITVTMASTSDLAMWVRTDHIDKDGVCKSGMTTQIIRRTELSPEQIKALEEFIKGQVRV